MPRTQREISLTDFVDIAARTGTLKATKVKEVKLRPDYDPRFDFYRGIREPIVRIIKDGADPSELKQLAEGARDLKKRPAYLQIAEGFELWRDGKVWQWFDPPRRVYSAHGMKVRVNPELGISRKTKAHIVKLYFKDDELSIFKIKVILSLMKQTLRPHCEDQTIMSILDTRAGKIYSWKRTWPSLMPLVNAELAYIASLWDNV
jgi:hypothetical protein